MAEVWEPCRKTAFNFPCVPRNSSWGVAICLGAVPSKNWDFKPSKHSCSDSLQENIPWATFIGPFYWFLRDLSLLLNVLPFFFWIENLHLYSLSKSGQICDRNFKNFFNFLCFHLFPFPWQHLPMHKGWGTSQAGVKRWKQLCLQCSASKQEALTGLGRQARQRVSLDIPKTSESP